MSFHLELQRVTKAFGPLRAVDSLSFGVPKGSIFGLLGPNGAGKTTTIRMIMRVVLPDQGLILLDGEPMDDRRRERIGYLPEERGLYRRMKVLEHLRFLGEVRGLPREEAQRRASAWLERLGLAEKAQQKVEALSKGMQQKVQFAAALLHDPPLAILDEPFTGLDPIATRQLKDELWRLKGQGTTIIFSTHVLPQAEELCDWLCLINRGRAVVAGSLEDVMRRYSSRELQVKTSANLAAVEQIPGVVTVREKDGCYLVRLVPEIAPHQAVALVAQHVPVEAVEVHRPTLEEVFLRAVEEDHVSLA